ncbi:DUF2917 domain-containing protein [Inhella proteolytica]|uniref:DUF2917 domain-containing protein n=1 Tax=Inhella proteolytica TaxID=2795029 RepID=A0A931NHW7_9BURK|nr:DUF2917 domain-containing protein [Inhella proteolytica]MBH9578223.1 DUF2917 domain-containing protein [Inhella proteolytica]
MMNQANAYPNVWQLRTGQVLRHPLRRAETLQVCSGRLWLTTNGELDAPSQDWVLQAGDRLRLPQGQEVVVEAFADARFELNEELAA